MLSDNTCLLNLNYWTNGTVRLLGRLCSELYFFFKAPPTHSFVTGVHKTLWNMVVWCMTWDRAVRRRCLSRAICELPPLSPLSSQGSLAGWWLIGRVYICEPVSLVTLSGAVEGQRAEWTAVGAATTVTPRRCRGMDCRLAAIRG